MRPHAFFAAALLTCQAMACDEGQRADSVPATGAVRGAGTGPNASGSPDLARAPNAMTPMSNADPSGPNGMPSSLASSGLGGGGEDEAPPGGTLPVPPADTSGAGEVPLATVGTSGGAPGSGAPNSAGAAGTASSPAGVGTPSTGGSTGGTAPGGTANGGAAPGGTAPGGTANGGAANGGTGGAEQCLVDHGGEVPSLRERFAEHFSIGAAIDTRYADYSALLTKHMNSVTAEDQMKFEALQPSEGNFTYGTADQMVGFAMDNGMQVRGHALVWHRQTPSWVFSGTAEQVLQRMRNHITNVMQHFQGKVLVWDVVNEAIMDDGSFRTADEEEGQQSGWYGALGESYIAEAFRAARQADPTAKLFYNDYYNYHPVRRQAIYDLLATLLADGVPVDGVGLQGHLNLAPGTDPNEQSYHQTVENMEMAIEMYSSLGLDVQITELDVSVYLRGIQYTPDTFYTPATFTPEVRAQQAERYRAFFDMFRRQSDALSSVTFWGIADDNTWLSEFSSGRQDFPLLFDAQQQPKPAFWAVVDFCE